jgi:hypothetical protein
VGSFMALLVTRQTALWPRSPKADRALLSV